MAILHHMSLLLLLLLLITVVLSQGFEFDRDSCDSLLPNQKLRLVDNGKGHGRRVVTNAEHEPHFSAEDDDEGIERGGATDLHSHEEDELEMESDRGQYRLKPGTGASPFTINISETQYRRHRHLTVTILGPEFNAFILMAKQNMASKPQPVGVFEGLPASARFLPCVNRHDTVTNRDTGGKKDLKFQWKAPNKDMGSLSFVGTIVQKETYWANLKSDPFLFNNFPPSFMDCGRSKSCYRYSAKVPNCEPAHCDYVVITKITYENEIEFTIGGVVDNDGYIGMGFTLDKYKLSHVDLGACVRNGKNIEPRQYIVENWENGPRNLSKTLEVEGVDKDDPMIWCQYRRPLKTPGPHLADLTQVMHHALVWGSINTTTGLPILPSKSEVTFIPQSWNYNNTINMIHYVSDGSAALHPSLYISIVSFIFLRFVL